MAARTSGWTTALLSLAKLRLGFMRKYFSRLMRERTPADKDAQEIKVEPPLHPRKKFPFLCRRLPARTCCGRGIKLRVRLCHHFLWAEVFVCHDVARLADREFCFSFWCFSLPQVAAVRIPMLLRRPRQCQ